MYRIELEYIMSDCPACWKNFIDGIKIHQNKYDVTPSDAAQFINLYLKEYNAIFYSRRICDIKKSYVEFNNEEDAIIFKLKFGFYNVEL